MELKDLEIYIIGLELSNKAWSIFEKLPQTHQYHIGNQFLRSIDSIAANIAEGFGRYYYMDSIRFYYNARGSLSESIHWNELLFNRKLISEQEFEYFKERLREESVKLNKFITNLKIKIEEEKRRDTMVIR